MMRALYYMEKDLATVSYEDLNMHHIDFDDMDKFEEWFLKVSRIVKVVDIHDC